MRCGLLHRRVFKKRVCGRLGAETVERSDGIGLDVRVARTDDWKSWMVCICMQSDQKRKEWYLLSSTYGKAGNPSEGVPRANSNRTDN